MEKITIFKVLKDSAIEYADGSKVEIKEGQTYMLLFPDVNMFTNGNYRIYINQNTLEELVIKHIIEC